MVKQRFSSADVAAEAACLRQRCLGMRVANVYDINPKTYVLKLARSGEDGDKVLLLVESGSRFHTVEAMPEKADTPSNFTLKLRKHIRTRRLEAVKQLGVDRIVQLTFGSGEAASHLLLEFFAQGNVILTDDKFEVLTLLRSHRDDAKGMAIMARHPYPIHTIRLRQPLSADALQGALAGAAPDASLKGCLSELLPYGPLIAEHCVRSSGLDPSRHPAAAPLSGDEQASLLAGVRAWEAWLDACEDSGTPPEGFIFTKPPAGGKKGGVAAVGEAVEGPAVYEDFEPLLLKQREHKPSLNFPTFDAAVAEFFGKIQGQRSALQQAAKEKAAVGKLDAIRKDHEKRLDSLGKEAGAAELKAALIEYNLEAVDGALNAVREAVASGMDWRDLARMIKEERRAGNPVAGLIDSLQLERSRVTLLLSNWLDEEDGDDEAATRPATKVEVDLELSAHANARAYYDNRRKHQVKQQKTLDANQKAIKAAEKKAQQQLKQVRSSAVPVITRKPFWFEKFHWFVSSENYLVLSGRDAQQNELLVKRYLRKGDVYVHADLHGASTTVVKNHTPEMPIPPLTLSQAGQACVCRSQAWDAKVVTSAWWVHPEQVSRTAPTGEFLVTGSFMIRGRKNYLPPQPLVMGYGLMFGLAEESIPAHLGERAPRLVEGQQLTTGYLEAESEEEDEAAEGEGDEGAQGAGPAAAPSALEAFLDASADTLAAGGAAAAAPAVRRGSSTASGSAAAGDQLTAAFERYGLTDTLAAASSAAAAAAEAEEGDQQCGGGAEGGGAGRRHVSAKERKVLKKGQPGGTPGQQQQQGQPQQGQGGGSKAPQAPGGGSMAPKAQQEGKGSGKVAQPAAPAPSGKGGKGKKGGRDKYGDQDEEDRQLAAQLLQSAGQKKDRKQRKEERKERMAARKADRTGLTKQEITAEDIAKLTARPATAAEEGGAGSDAEDSDGGSGGAGPEDDQAPPLAQQAEQEQERESEGGSDGEGGSDAPSAGAEQEDGLGGEGGGEAHAAADDEAAEVAALLKEENVEALADDDKEKLTQLDSLTGVPRGEDILLFAIPVCAPYQVLTSYKYKVKMIPGTLKKGKAVRQAAELMLKGGDVTQRERDLIRAVPEMEALQTLCGTVKIQSAGLLKMKQASKKSKK